ncbi:hypothetical protein HY374_02610 [Candidatus Berkelbacteria bacterium]|nr:hypothetical protein [Candidatus Berkelbacteria bacterium]
MDTFWYILFIAATVVLVVALVRAAQHRGDADRRQAERATYEERQWAEQVGRAEAALGRTVDSFFPHLRADVAARVKGGARPQAALQEAILATPGVRLGTSHLGLPVVVPSAFRTRHAALIGKSGYGKSSAMIRMIRQDFLSGHPTIVLCPEREMFEDHLLGLIPESRLQDSVYLAPGRSTAITFNPFLLEPGDQPSRLSAELFSVIKRAVGEDGSLGSRSDPLLANAIALIVGRSDASLAAVRRVLTDTGYRAAVVEGTADPYLRDYWTRVYPQYPSGAETPLLNRLDGFLRNPSIRDVLTNPVSSVSMRSVIERKLVLLADLSGLSPEDMRLIGELLVAKLSLELIRRERIPGSERTPVFAYVDEFPAVVGTAEESWRSLWSRGRKYGAAICVGLQHSSQLSQKLREELFGNTSGIFVFNVAAKDAGLIRRELLMPNSEGVTKPVTVEALVSLGVGEAYGRIGTGTCAVRIMFEKPIPEQDRVRAARARETSWKQYAAPPLPGQAGMPSCLLVESRPEKLAGTFDGSRDSTTVEGPGRGGQQHKLLQQLVRKWGEEVGFKATIEQEILGGAGRVDVALTAGEKQIACEIAISSKAHQICASVNKYLSAGFNSVLVVGTDHGVQRQIERALDAAVTAKDRGKVRVLSPEETRLFLAAQGDDESARKRPAGYRVRVKYEPASAADCRERLRAFADLLASATGRGPA